MRLLPRLLSPLPVLGFLFLLAPGRAAADPVTFADSTVADSWTLPNGLRVTTRHIPRARAVAITVAVPVGSDADPADRRGLTRLAAEVQMMAAAGSVPERSEGEMESLRPLGWSLKVTPHATQLSEIAATDRFAGVLQQVAQRLRGVTVTDKVLDEAVATVREERGAAVEPDQMLHDRAGDYARGLDDAAIADAAAGRGLDRVRARDLPTLLRRMFAARHAVLAIAGDLSRVDLHTVIANEFGSIPAGDPLPAPARTLRPSVHRLGRPEVRQPVGVVGVIAPAVADSAHPEFLINVLLLGQNARDTWSSDKTLASRFRYAIFDDPDLVRFFPSAPPDSLQPSVLTLQLDLMVHHLLDLVVPDEEYRELTGEVVWLLGGAMPTPILQGMQKGGAALNYGCNLMATRELLGGEPFWSVYRQRLQAVNNKTLRRWAAYVLDPRNQVTVLFVPQGR